MASESYLAPVSLKLSECSPCSTLKTMRSSHCSSCGSCIPRMDHHCPWTLSCVGHRNHKSFMCFVFWMMIGAMQYCFRAISFIGYLNDEASVCSAKEYKPSLFFIVLYIFTCLVLFPMTLMLVSLFVFHMTFPVSRNMTTLEQMKGVAIGRPDSASKINYYDQGILANMYNFFGRTYFWHFLPIEKDDYSDSTKFSHLPVYGPGKSIPFPDQDYETVISSAEENIKQFKVQVNSQIHEVSELLPFN